MSAEADRIMFEVYRQPGSNARYRVVYFTELDEENRDAEINAAMDGEHFYDGFIAVSAVEIAKSTISAFVARLNEGLPGSPQELDALLAPFGCPKLRCGVL